MRLLLNVWHDPQAVLQVTSTPQTLGFQTLEVAKSYKPQLIHSEVRRLSQSENYPGRILYDMILRQETSSRLETLSYETSGPHIVLNGPSQCHSLISYF